jgi:tRNA C32,U32 (ribose-2'-O)-methylase TrmJ
MRRLVARTRIEHEEISLLRGMLTSVGKLTKKID